MIYIGADHRGFKLKEYIKKRFVEDNLMYEDKGDLTYTQQDDYVDYAVAVSEAVKESLDHKGILLCGSGAGVDMVANKIDGIRCALVQDEMRAKQAREHENANVIALPADILGEEQAYQIIKAFLATPFSGEDRHKRRLDKMVEVEKKN